MRHWGQELIDEAMEQSSSPEAKRDRIRRRYLIEGSFAQGANLHHFKRSRWRRLEKQRMQDWIICSIQNIRILIKHSLPPKLAAATLAQVKMYVQNQPIGLKERYNGAFQKLEASLTLRIGCRLNFESIL